MKGFHASPAFTPGKLYPATPDKTMVRLAQERILLIGDTQHELEAALGAAAPAAQVTRVENVFDGIVELAARDYSTVVANAEPIERRPEAAVRALRELVGDGGRIILFGHPTLEPVSRKMLEFGCDDYVITPPAPVELQQIFAAVPPMRLARTDEEENGGDESRGGGAGVIASDEAPLSVLHAVPVAEVLLESLVQHPGAAQDAAVNTINAMIAPHFQLRYQQVGKPVPANEPAGNVISVPVRMGNDVVAHLHLGVADQSDEIAARHFLSQAAGAFGKLATLQDRHNRLFTLGITDQLTGVYNRRYFEHFLAKILEKAKSLRFQVTLLLFDIDNFKKYNDDCGHGLGDEILRETAALMKRCCREHDLVARIGGDEFAVVFWEKEPPRQPKDPGVAVTPGRVPQETLQILRRFRTAISTREFSGLGVNGRGILTISGGLASFPWDGRTVQELVEAADRALTFGAKKGGKNSIYLVGGDAQTWE
jgi:GGDEF domain-containing protein